MQSIRDTNPDYRRYFILVDKKPFEEVGDPDLYHLIEADALGIRHFDDMAMRYDVMEFNTAVKPFAIEWLFDNTDAGTVIYLDPDIRVYRKLRELETAVAEGASVVVTPHLTRPLEDGKLPNDYQMLQAGVFNLGFIAVTRTAEAREFVRWWGRRLETQCHADTARNLFTDQRWVDLAPCFVEQLTVLRDVSYNVAYWNLMQRRPEKRGTKLYIEGIELAFFHFSGLDRANPTLVSKHQNRLEWNDIKPFQSLFNGYRETLFENGWGTQSKSPYVYDKVGELKISPVVRRLYRAVYPETLENVKVDEGFLLAMCNAPAGAPLDTQGAITQLMRCVYETRPDLQSAFSLTTAEGISEYVAWYTASAGREYGLDERLLDPRVVGEAAAASPNLLPPMHPNARRPWLFRRWRKIRKWLLERV